LNKGDILFIRGANPEKLKIGDIIIFEGNQRSPIIHRIIRIREENGERIFETMGDNNNGQLTFEKEITENEIIGKTSLKIIPYLGWVKLIFFEHSRPQEQKGFCAES
jgi:signal peptidase I